MKRAQCKIREETRRTARRISSIVNFTRIGVLVGVVLSAGCARPPDQISYPVIVDDSPTWAPDGSYIAFQRRLPSQYGPSGLYLIPSAGGTPMLLTTRAYYDLAYDPTGATIVAAGSSGLVSISATNGSEQLLAYTTNGISSPHVSPDGTKVAYARSLRAYDEPADSAGIHIVDLLASTDTPLLDNNGTIVNGGDPRWAPSQAFIAYTSAGTLSVIDMSDHSVTVLATASSGTFFVDPRWVQAGSAILFSEFGPARRSFVVNLATGQVMSLSFYLGDFPSLAPKDSAYVFGAPDRPLSPTRYSLLYVRRLSDTGGSTIRQLTYYAAPPAGPMVAP
jgi:dipeptidyl aminopeptidase/acylaminoacyl peptidase